MYTLLDRINSPSDIKPFTLDELRQLSCELRSKILEVVSQTGGHVATNMGIVELTLALHYVFDTPRDKLVFDVSNQCYPHKLLTGRKEKFQTLRTYKGISGFAKRDESEYDTFGAGHASTGISAALGMVVARDLAKEDYKVVCVVGDGALTGGLAFEGLNNAGSLKKDFLVILNDNSMSISQNVGAISKYLTDVLTDSTYNKIKKELWTLGGKLKKLRKLRDIFANFEESVKGFLVPGIFFEKLGFRYFGPIDGHDLEQLIKTLSSLKEMKGPLLLHVTTVKGKGYKPAEEDACKFHGVGPFEIVSGKVKSSATKPTYTEVFSNTLIQIAEKDKDVVAITAAMCTGTGLTKFAEKFPERFFDVGIAEQHSATFAAGLSALGKKPFLALYSTFLQRSFDQVIHDIALQNLPVVLCIDRAGLVGEDGPTHHGVFDIAYLRLIPNLTILAPKDGNELKDMLWWAKDWQKGPVAIRYPRTSIPDEVDNSKISTLALGTWEILTQGEEVLILATGSCVKMAQEALQELSSIKGTLVNARFIKPLDEKLLESLAPQFNKILTIEEGSLKGGFGSAVIEFLGIKNLNHKRIIRLGIEDNFITQGARNILLREIGLDKEGIISAILKLTDRKFKSKEKEKLTLIQTVSSGQG